MVPNRQCITIITSRRPVKKSINDELRWFGTSLGLFNLRDKDQSCFRVFIELIKNAKNRSGMSSDELAYKLSLSRGTVVHHINKLMQSGIVVSEHNKYFLRVDTLGDLVEEIKKDTERALADLKQAADEIDNYLGLQ